jgi:hypothetical protein
MKKHTNNLHRLHKFIILWGPIFTLLVFYSNAQTVSPCPTDNLSNYPGAWKHFSGYSAPGHIKAKPGSYDKTAADANLEKLLDLAKKAYPKPMGGNANFTKHLDFSNVDDYLPFGHKLYIGHPGFVCTVGDKVTETFETGVYLVFHINNYAPFVFPVNAPEVPGSDLRIGFLEGSYSDYGINGQRVFQIPVNFVGSNGWMDHYTEKIYSNEEPREQWFVIRKENIPLFRYITRMEYLQQYREEIKAYRDEYLRVTEESYKKYPEAFSGSYKSLPEFKKRAEYVVSLIDDYLKNKSEEELNLPFSELINHNLLLFSDQSEIKFHEGRFHLAFFNEEYLDKNLPHHIPQFIIVELSGPAHDKTGRDSWKYNFRKKMMAGLDFTSIHNMLTK